MPVKILVVDDDENIQEMLRTGLETAGHQVEIAVDEKSFRGKLSESRPDIVLMDISIPGVDGISLCKELKNTPGLFDVHVIIVTAYNDEKTVHDAFLFGAADFITKPFQIADINKKIEKVVKR